MNLITSVLLSFAHLQPFLPLMMHLQSRRSLRYWPVKYLDRSIYDSLPFGVAYALNDLLFSGIALFGAAFVIMPMGSYNALTQMWMRLLR